MDQIEGYLRLLQWGAYAAFVGIALDLVLIVLLAMARTTLRDCRRRLDEQAQQINWLKAREERRW